MLSMHGVIASFSITRIGICRMSYFATLKSKDDDYDNVSDLNRPSTFRLNIGITKATYRSLFGTAPSRHDAADVAETNYDFAALDQLFSPPCLRPAILGLCAQPQHGNIPKSAATARRGL